MSSTGQVILVDPLDGAIPVCWDEFARRHQLGAEWEAASLRAAAWTTQSRILMAISQDTDGQPVALFYCRLIGPTWPYRFRSTWLPPMAGLVEVRRPPGAHPGFAVDPKLDRAGRAGVLAALSDALRRRLDRRPFVIAFRHLDADDLRWLADRGSVVLRVQPAAVLDNRWQSIDAYLTGLHHKRRNSIRRLRRRISDDPNVIADTEPAIDALEAARLVELVRSRHRRRWLLEAPVTVAQFAALTAAPDTWFTTYREAGDGRLLAFAAWRDTPTAIVSALWGAEEPVSGGRRDLYFDAAFRSVEAMIERGRPQLLMGKGMTDVKASFGARLVPQYTVISILRRT